MIGFIAIVAWTHMIDCDLSQKLVVVQNYYWEKSQTGIILVGKIPERIKLVGTYTWYTVKWFISYKHET